MKSVFSKIMALLVLTLFAAIVFSLVPFFFKAVFSILYVATLCVIAIGAFIILMNILD